MHRRGALDVRPVASTTHMITFLSIVACTATLLPISARAQIDVLDEQSIGGSQAGADYFQAPYDPRVKAWLTLVEGRHASERVWKLFRAGDNNDALEDTQYTLARFPNHPRALNLLVEIGKATDQTSMPLSYFEKALKYYPQHGFTHAQYGRYLVQIGATSAGIAEFTEALRLDPDLLQARVWLNEVQPGLRSQPAPRDTTRVGPKIPEANRSAGTKRK